MINVIRFRSNVQTMKRIVTNLNLGEGNEISTCPHVQAGDKNCIAMPMFTYGTVHLLKIWSLSWNVITRLKHDDSDQHLVNKLTVSRPVIGQLLVILFSYWLFWINECCYVVMRLVHVEAQIVTANMTTTIIESDPFHLDL